MGGCGSKPQVLKDGAAEQAPEPAPEKVELIEGGISEAQPVEEEEKTVEDAETAVADHDQVGQEVKEIESEEAIDTNPPHQDSQSVIQEIKEVAIHQVAEQVKEMHENQGIRDSSQSETITALHDQPEVASHKNEPEVVTNELADDQEAKSSEANPKIETDDEMVNNIPAAAEENVETVELEKKAAGGKIETEEKEKTQKGRKKPRPEDNPIVSFFSSLVGQKR